MRSSCLKHFFRVFVLAICINAYGQTELKNKIVDFSTLLPLENASIYIENTTIGTVSNSDGKFALLVPKEFEKDSLIISSIGYKSFKSVISDFDTTMEVFLVEDIASLDEIVL